MKNENIYNIKVSCTSVIGRAKPYRIVAIKKTNSLFKLAEQIIFSFGFYNDHSFGFYDNKRKWSNSKEFYELFADTPEKNIKKVSIEKVFSDGKWMFFLYDYGDQWNFSVRLLNKSESLKGIVYPAVVKEHGECPKQY